MGTPMAPNHGDLLVDNFKKNSLCHFFFFLKKNWVITFGMSWFYERYFLHIFSSYEYLYKIFSVNKESLDHIFIFTQNFSKRNKIKPKIKFEIQLTKFTFLM